MSEESPEFDEYWGYPEWAEDGYQPKDMILEQHLGSDQKAAMDNASLVEQIEMITELVQAGQYL